VKEGRNMKLTIMIIIAAVVPFIILAKPAAGDSTVINNFNLVRQADTLSPHLFDDFYHELMTTGTTDFLGMRLAYFNSSLFSPTGVNFALKDSLYAAIDSKKFDAGKIYLDSLLKKYFPVIPVQLWAETYYLAKGDTAMAKIHGKYYDELLNALLKSGDGYSVKTGYIVIDIAEEYELMEVWKMNFEEQRLIDSDSNSFDYITAKNTETGKSEAIYFNITLIQKKLAERLMKKVNPAH
jgi:hypothetical protein